MDAQEIRDSFDSLLNGIKILIDKTVSKASFDKTYRGYVSKIDDDGYTIVIENMAYPNTHTISDTKLSIGDVVFVLFPRNNSNNRVILK